MGRRQTPDPSGSRQSREALADGATLSYKAQDRGPGTVVTVVGGTQRTLQLSTDAPGMCGGEPQKHRSRDSGSRKRKQVWRGPAALSGAEPLPQITQEPGPATAPAPPRATPGSPYSDNTSPGSGLLLYLIRERSSYASVSPFVTRRPPGPHSWQCCGVRGGGGHQRAMQSK